MDTKSAQDPGVPLPGVAYRDAGTNIIEAHAHPPGHISDPYFLYKANQAINPTFRGRFMDHPEALLAAHNLLATGTQKVVIVQAPTLEDADNLYQKVQAVAF